MSKRQKRKTVHRSSVTGRFVTAKYAEKHSRITEEERVIIGGTNSGGPKKRKKR